MTFFFEIQVIQFVKDYVLSNEVYPVCLRGTN